MAALPVGLWIRLGDMASQPGWTMTSGHQELMNKGRGAKGLLEQKPQNLPWMSRPLLNNDYFSLPQLRQPRNIHLLWAPRQKSRQGIYLCSDAWTFLITYSICRKQIYCKQSKNISAWLPGAVWGHMHFLALPCGHRGVTGGLSPGSGGTGPLSAGRDPLCLSSLNSYVPEMHTLYSLTRYTVIKWFKAFLWNKYCPCSRSHDQTVFNM